ncbi:Cof-type HAD-IIB family hydrolase [Anoxybacillus flavithermus]|uniref:Cof-type HAD-IIB family hydrolase n=1 Tax=Anoxybacillus flavithermus TaxID=33934 RepID=A0A2G5RRB8_9BACL|nr:MULTISPECIES: Cof-type HAD-IIB family hydrolase [Anoxybacillus]KFZ42705.1 haloacid dehalogenase [Anoxybacillus sp. KU2-6(11)]PIC05305.1 Cof-type HAD-IIB family hydrolase [Anoxybacillus flavithermus]
MYKLLALNIDGTLLKSNGKLEKKTKEAIDFVKKKDVYVTLMTSRNFLSAKKVAKALKLDSYLVTFQGGLVAKSLEEKLYEAVIPAQKTFDIVHVLEHFNCNVRLLHERYSIGNRKKIKNNMIAKTILGDPFFYPAQFVDSLSDVLRDDPMDVMKIDVFYSNEDECDEIVETITHAFPDVSFSVSDGKIELLPKNVSKLNGLIRLGSELGISLKEMVVIGDHLDDIPAIEAAGLGVAMGNAPKEVKAVADWVTRSNEQLGVAYMIKEHFRKQHRPQFLRQIRTIEKK